MWVFDGMLTLARYLVLASYLVLLGSCAVVSSDSRALKVFVLAGQSNMLGRRSVIDDLPSELQMQQGGNLIFADGHWISLEPGVYQEQEQGLGPELSFAYRMAQQLGEPIGIIKHSRGGTDLAVEWAPDDPNSLYTGLVAKVRDAALKKDIEILGMAWMQGESDSEVASMALGYRQNLSGLVAAARTDFSAPDMVFVAGRINPPVEDRYAYADQVRGAQTENDIENYAFVDCDPLPKLADNLHYDTQGIVALGDLLADKTAAMLSEAVSDN